MTKQHKPPNEFLVEAQRASFESETLKAKMLQIDAEKFLSQNAYEHQRAKPSQALQEIKFEKAQIPKRKEAENNNCQPLEFVKVKCQAELQ